MHGRLNVFETCCIYVSLLERMYWYFIEFAQFDFIGSTGFLVYGFFYFTGPFVIICLPI